MFVALLAAASLAGSEPPAIPEGLVPVPPGSVIRGIGQGATIDTPRLRVAGAPVGGDPPQVCTVIAAEGVSIWQASGCVFIRSGLANSVNGKMFPAGSKVCIGHRFHPGLCPGRLHFPGFPRLRRPPAAPPGVQPQ